MPTKRTAKRDARFFAAIADGRSIAKAARAARYGPASVYRWRNQDPAFAERWADAHVKGVDVIEEEADRRGRDGVEEAVYYRRRRVGMTRRYSDGLLLARLKALRPAAYRDSPPPKQVNVVLREFDMENEFLRLLDAGRLTLADLSCDVRETLEKARAGRVKEPAK